MLHAMQRELWVLDGIIEHGFITKPLQKVSDNFEKIDAVPRGYFYHEIYASRKLPFHLQAHQEAVKTWRFQHLHDNERH